jgi:hypothetical protein
MIERKSWVLSFATIVVAGYAIEMNEVYFGAGDPDAESPVVHPPSDPPRSSVMAL